MDEEDIPEQAWDDIETFLRDGVIGGLDEFIEPPLSDAIMHEAAGMASEMPYVESSPAGHTAGHANFREWTSERWEPVRKVLAEQGGASRDTDFTPNELASPPSSISTPSLAMNVSVQESAARGAGRRAGPDFWSQVLHYVHANLGGDPQVIFCRELATKLKKKVEYQLKAKVASTAAAWRLTGAPAAPAAAQELAAAPIAAPPRHRARPSAKRSEPEPPQAYAEALSALRLRAPEGSSPLHILTDDHAGLCRALLESGEDALSRDSDGATPLHRAAEAGHAGIVVALLDFLNARRAPLRAPPADERDGDGQTALMLAALEGHAAVCETLLAAGADPGALSTKMGVTVLDSAAVGGSPQVCFAVIEALQQRGTGALEGALAHRNPTGMPPLHAAAAIGSAESCRVLLAAGADPFAPAPGFPSALALAVGAPRPLGHSRRDVCLELLTPRPGWKGSLVQLLTGAFQGVTPLHAAAGAGDAGACQALIEAAQAAGLGAAGLLGAKGPQGATPLHACALGRPSPETTEVLLVAGSDPAAPGGPEMLRGASPLLVAVMHSSEEVALAMLTPASATAPDADGTTALHLAAARGYLRLCEALLAIPEVVLDARRRADAATPLMYAAAHGSDAACQLLLDRGASPRAEYTKSRGIALHSAAQGGHAAVCAVLLKRDPGSAAVVTAKGALALHVAASHGRGDFIRALLSGGPSGATAADARDPFGATPLMYAAREKHREACAVLIELGADVTATSDEGLTALHNAAHAGSVEVCALLLQHGASAHAEDKGQGRPLQYAVIGYFPAVCEVLVNQGRADLAARDGQGYTAVHLARLLGGKAAECAAVLEAAERRNATAAAAAVDGCM